MSRATSWTDRAESGFLTCDEVRQSFRVEGTVALGGDGIDPMGGELDATFEAADLFALVPVPVGVPIRETAYRPRVNLEARNRCRLRDSKSLASNGSITADSLGVYRRFSVAQSSSRHQGGRLALRVLRYKRWNTARRFGTRCPSAREPGCGDGRSAGRGISV